MNILANGIRYYVDQRGDHGDPLLVLHGGLGSTELFAPDLAAIGAGRRVIAVDLHGHGRTELGDRPIRYEAMADDLASILDFLGVGEVDACGYSLGAGVAFRLAVQHAARVRRLALVSAGLWTDSFYPEVVPMQQQMSGKLAPQLAQTPIYSNYMRCAPRPDDFPRLLDRMGDLMRTPFDYRGDVAKVRAHTMLVFGDADTFRLEAMIEQYKLFGGGQRDAGWMREHMPRNRLAILPDVTHYELYRAPALAATVKPFLDGTSVAIGQFGA
nr:alpha/beta hydrolase [Kofleriaceae bacterium]